MNLSVANGLAVQDAYKGVLEYQSSMTSTRTSNPDDKQYHYIGIDSAYSIRTQNYVFARRFMGDGTWIDKTCDASKGTYEGAGSGSTGTAGNVLSPGGTYTLSITIPKFTISAEQRLFSADTATYDSLGFKLDPDIATETWVKNNFATKADVNTVIGRLNALIRAYDSHKHKYMAPKADAAGNSVDTDNFNGGIQELDRI